MQTLHKFKFLANPSFKKLVNCFSVWHWLASSWIANFSFRPENKIYFLPPSRTRVVSSCSPAGRSPPPPPHAEVKEPQHSLCFVYLFIKANSSEVCAVEPVVPSSP